MRIPELAALVLVFVTATASAQPKSALVQDRDAPARDPVQVMRQSGTGDCSSNACVIEFSDLTVPAGKRLVIRQVFVRAVTDVAVPGGFLVHLAGAPGGGSTYVEFRGQGDPTRVANTVLQPLTFYVEAGRFPQFSIYETGAPASTSAEVTVTGSWVALP